MAETITILSAALVALPLTLADEAGEPRTVLAAPCRGPEPGRTEGVDVAFFRAWVAANPDHPAVVNGLLSEAEDVPEAAPVDTGEVDALRARIAAMEADVAAAKPMLDAAVAERDTAEAERDAARSARDAAVTERDAAVAERDAAIAARDAAQVEIARLTGELEAAHALMNEATASQAEEASAAEPADAASGRRKRTAA